MSTKEKEQKKSEEVSEVEDEATETVFEMDQPVWAVISFDRCLATELTYSEAVSEMQRPENGKYSGKCIVTAEVAKRFGAKK